MSVQQPALLHWQAVERQPSPGELFMFAPPVAYTADAIEWLMVRFHPDSRQSLLVVPCGDPPFWGPGDLDLEHEMGRPLVAHCTCGLWLPTDVFSQKTLWVDTVTAIALRHVRLKLAGLARGTDCVTEEEQNTDEEPEYHRYMRRVLRHQSRAAQLVN